MCQIFNTRNCINNVLFVDKVEMSVKGEVQRMGCEDSVSVGVSVLVDEASCRGDNTVLTVRGSGLDGPQCASRSGGVGHNLSCMPLGPISLRSWRGGRLHPIT